MTRDLIAKYQEFHFKTDTRSCEVCNLQVITSRGTRLDPPKTLGRVTLFALFNTCQDNALTLIADA